MKRLILSLILAFSCALNGQVPQLVKANKINEVFSYIKQGEKTLVLFDIHFTLGIPVPAYGLYLIDKDSVQIVKDLQANSDVKACALTASTPDKLHKRIKELKAIGFDFAQSTPFKEAEYTIESNNEQCKVNHAQGVICSGLCAKKDVIKRFLQEHDYKPDHIIIVDDKVSCLFTDEKDTDELGVQKITNIHFTRIMGGREFNAFKPISKMYKKYPKTFYATITAAVLGTLAYRNKEMLNKENWLWFCWGFNTVAYSSYGAKAQAEIEKTSSPTQALLLYAAGVASYFKLIQASQAGILWKIMGRA